MTLARAHVPALKPSHAADRPELVALWLSRSLKLMRLYGWECIVSCDDVTCLKVYVTLPAHHTDTPVIHRATRSSVIASTQILPMAGTSQVESGSDYERTTTPKVSRKSILLDRKSETPQGEKRKRSQQDSRGLNKPTINRAQGM